MLFGSFEIFLVAKEDCYWLWVMRFVLKILLSLYEIFLGVVNALWVRDTFELM